MASSLGARLGVAVGVIDRVTRAIALGDAPLSTRAIEFEARRLLASTSPLHVEANLRPVVDGVLGLGPIQALVEDPEVTDVLVNGPSEIWVDLGQGLIRTELSFQSSDDLMVAVERMLAPLGLRLDRAAPMVEARLPDGSRLHAVIPPAAADAPLVAIRRFAQRVATLDDLIEAGTARPDQVSQLALAVESGKNVIVSGGTGAGKTTLLNLLGALIPEGERVVTIEDAAELSFPGHVVRLEARPGNTEGKGEITIRSLLRSALRLRPDRIVVGEVRGPEALDLVWALNTGHRGSMTTVHANSPSEALWRIETLALSAGNTSETAVARQLQAAVDMVVQIERTSTGRRIRAIQGCEELTEEREWS